MIPGEPPEELKRVIRLELGDISELLACLSYTFS